MHKSIVCVFAVLKSSFFRLLQIETADPFELVLTWDMSWSDVLDILRYEFGRACVFSYEGRDKKGKPTRVNVASEGEFDSFCSWAETRGFRCEVLVRSATFMPSEFISAPLEEQFPMHPYVKKKNEPVDEEALLVKEALRLQNGEDNDSGDEDEKLMIQEGDEPSRGQTFWERIEDSPYPWSHMIGENNLSPKPLNPTRIFQDRNSFIRSLHG